MEEIWVFWDRLAANWKVVLDKYVTNSSSSGVFENDMPYWHGERANVGFLCVAAWQMECVAITEYYTERFEKEEKSIGECDLWINSGVSSFSVEAKQIWPKKYLKSSVEKSLKEAKNQLHSLELNNQRASDFLFSTCFIVPVLERKESFGNFVGHIKKDFNSDINRVYSYVPPDIPNLEEYMVWNNDNEKYPGVIMVVEKS